MASERTTSDRPDVGVDYRVDKNAVVTIEGWAKQYEEYADLSPDESG